MLARMPATAAPELELKFQIRPEAVEGLARSFPSQAAAISHLRAAYFDTPACTLRDAGFSLRVRHDGDIFTQTLKHRGKGGLFERDEWETEVSTADLDHEVLARTPAAAVVGDLRLEPVFTVAFERRLHSWVRGDAVVQVSIDSGSISAGDLSEPIAELELELIEGPPSILFELARELQSRTPLTLAFTSKAERGYRLAGHDGTAAFDATRSAIRPETTAGDAFQIIARDSLIQIAANSALLLRSNNPEVLHQIRVGLRRMRTAVTVFGAMLDPQGRSFARLETRWLAAELAPARDIDVFLRNCDRPDEVDEDPGRAAFLQAVRIAQTKAYEQALAAIRSTRYDALLLWMGEWIEAGAWRYLDDKGPKALRETAIKTMAPPVMDQLHRRVMHRSRGFRHLDSEARHTLRKRARTLRYAAAFFGETLAKRPKRRDALMKHLRTLQDRLGELNDIAVAETVARRTLKRRTGSMAAAASLELVQIGKRQPELLDAARQAVKAYRKSRVFWSGKGIDLNH